MTSSADPIKVAVIDPHKITREGVVAALSSEPRFRLLAAVDTISELHSSSSVRPDVYVTELFGVADSEWQLHELFSTPTVVFTVATTGRYRIRCWLVGARAMLSKTVDAHTLRNAIDDAQRPIELIDTALARAILDEPSLRGSLSEELKEILELCRKGRGRTEIEEATHRDYPEFIAELRTLCEIHVGKRLVLDEPPFARPTIGPEKPPEPPIAPARSAEWEFYQQTGLFSPAETQVLEKLAEGFTLQDIAGQRGSSKLTVKKQLESALGKVYVRRQQKPDGTTAEGHEFSVEFGQLFALRVTGGLVHPERFTRLDRYER